MVEVSSVVAALAGTLVGGLLTQLNTKQHFKHADRTAKERAVDETVRRVMAAAEAHLGGGAHQPVPVPHPTIVSSSLFSLEHQLRALGYDELADRASTARQTHTAALEARSQAGWAPTGDSVKQMADALDEVIATAVSWWQR